MTEAEAIKCIKFTIKQVRKALKFGIPLNLCNRNLKIIIEQYWQKEVLVLRDEDKRKIPLKSKKSCKLPKDTKAGFNKLTTSEHVVPQTIIIDFLIHGPLEDKYIKKVLNEFICLVAVAKEEDKKLNKKYRYKMPPEVQAELPSEHDGEKAWVKAINKWIKRNYTWSRYKEVGIELCKCKECKKCKYYPKHKL